MPNSSRSPSEPKRKRFGLPRTARLITNREFRRVYSRGRRTRGRSLVIVGLRSDRSGHRVGLSVSKEHGRAVRRNKIKRLLREAFRLERPKLPGQFDLVLIPQPREGKFELTELRAELVDLVRKLASGGGRGRRRPKRRAAK